MSPQDELRDFRTRFPDPRPRILAALAEHRMSCQCAHCRELYAENVGAIAQGHRIADALERALQLSAIEHGLRRLG